MKSFLRVVRSHPRIHKLGPRNSSRPPRGKLNIDRAKFGRLTGDPGPFDRKIFQTSPALRHQRLEAGSISVRVRRHSHFPLREPFCKRLYVIHGYGFVCAKS
jgi:hypothetical protein